MSSNLKMYGKYMRGERCVTSLQQAPTSVRLWATSILASPHLPPMTLQPAWERTLRTYSFSPPRARPLRRRRPAAGLNDDSVHTLLGILSQVAYVGGGMCNCPTTVCSDVKMLRGGGGVEEA